MKKKYILWDFDGTVLNSNNIIIDSWQATSLHYTGKKLPIEDVVATFGETIRYTARKFWPGVDVEEAITYYRNYQAENLEGNLSIFDGIKELLDGLKRDGISNSIVTSRLKETTLEYIDRYGLSDCFDVVITNDDCKTHKPDPEPVTKCIRKLEDIYECNISKDECIMIGDTRFDVGCAKNAGVDSALVGWSHNVDMEVLRETDTVPDYTFDRIEDVRLVLESM